MICILLSTYNGAQYLEAQLESLIHQKDVHIKIVVRDDGSTDGTKNILDTWQNKGLLTWYGGPNKGPAFSFMDLLSNAPDADYYAFCDQDDIWLPEKLQVATSKLHAHTHERALYLSNTILVDDNLNMIGEDSNNYNNTFGETFLRNPATGCTMVFNKELRNEVLRYIPSYLYMHDGWVHKICIATNGYTFYDHQSYILYRQHNHNVVGGQKSFIKRWKRRYNVFIKKDAGIRYKTMYELYKGFATHIPSQNKILLEKCINYKKSITAKIKFMTCPLIKTPHKRTRLYFLAAVMINKY